MKLSVVIFLLSFAGEALAQTPVVSNILNAGIGDTSFAPMSVVYVYGAFPKGLARDFSITTGGRPGFVVAANSTGYITAVLPPDTPLGMQPLVVSYRGSDSNTYPIALRQYAPEFETMSVVPVTDSGPKFPLPSYYPFSHSSNVTPVTLTAPAAPGERLVSLISGVGTTNPPIKLGGINSFTPLAVQPTVTVAGIPAQVMKAGTSGTNIEVDFVIPNSAPIGFDPVVLTIAGFTANTVTIPVGSPFVTAVLNAASFGSPGTVAPGSIISIFGAGFGPADNLSAFPSTSVNGTSVMFGNTPAPVFALATMEGQINALVPSELLTSGTVDLTIKDSSGTSSVLTLNLAPAIPGIFFFADPTVPARHQAAALLPNTAWLSMPSSMAAAMGIPNDCSAIAKASTCAQPAHAGDVLQIFVTGLGKTTPQGDPAGKSLATGVVAPADGNPLYLTVVTPTVTIGGLPAQVQFSGIAPGFAGLYQINVRIHAGVQPGNDVPVQVGMPGSPVDTATIAVAAQ